MVKFRIRSHSGQRVNNCKTNVAGAGNERAENGINYGYQRSDTWEIHRVTSNRLENRRVVE